MTKHIHFPRANRIVLAFLLFALILSLTINQSPAARASGIIDRKNAEKAIKSTMPDTKHIAVSPGTWGGRGASVVVNKKSVKIEFDCAEGEIRQQLTIDKKGGFKVNGFYMRQPFGPTLKNNEPKFAPAIYKGRIVGKTMTLSVAWNYTDPPIAEYVVERGKTAQITKCR